MSLESGIVLEVRMMFVRREGPWVPEVLFMACEGIAEERPACLGETSFINGVGEEFCITMVREGDNVVFLVSLHNADAPVTTLVFAHEGEEDAPSSEEWHLIQQILAEEGEQLQRFVQGAMR